MEAPKKYICVLGFLLFLGIAELGGVNGAGECGKASPDTEAFKLIPCASAAKDENATPSSACCLQVKKLGQNPGCLCTVMLSNTAKNSGVNPEIAITIPKRCNLSDRPVGYKCGVICTYVVLSYSINKVHLKRMVITVLAGLHHASTGGDFKASNILLDGVRIYMIVPRKLMINYNAKISDFGLAKLGPSGGESHVTTRVMGTYGYAAPEYVATGHLYVKSDVYDFSVVLLEMLTGLRALDSKRPSGQHNLIDWTKPFLSNKRKLKSIMDVRIEGQYSSKAALIAAQLTIQSSLFPICGSLISIPQAALYVFTTIADTTDGLGLTARLVRRKEA
ncbi:hypothetical protein TEA_018271 [Camellia sinensis var. sinensis]|uniref:Protein kinase domain-containing protein n=1 Tax=Camellia sinensis var. sinensis TaxID=542762 RepID=A0A4S4DHJ6_CAMSN|nr:hypothetical protein TEA_018271 [Camellia sinensis var. sinensis]